MTIALDLRRLPFHLTRNQRILLKEALKAPETPRNALADIVGISAPSAMRAVRPLVEAGILQERRGDPDGRGKPPGLVQVMPNKLVLLGISISSSRVRVLLSDIAGADLTMLEDVQEWTDAAKQLATVDALVAQALDANKDAILVGAGIVVQGFFISRGKRFAARWDMEGWAAIDLHAHMETRLGVPATIRNDGKALAVHVAQEQPYRHFFCIGIGTGIGGGLVSEGRLIEGRFGNAGEIGQIFTDTAARPIEARFLEASGCSDWSEWDGFEALSNSQSQVLKAWLDTAAHSIGQAAGIALALLDFEAVYLCARIPEDILEALARRIYIAPLGQNIAGEDGPTNPPPKVIAYPLAHLAKLASQMAKREFLNGVAPPQHQDHPAPVSQTGEFWSA
ncbi:ROK family transcriptional regulator [Aliiroseovarius sp. 2305UL8-7]|uniref:ROK family transcriptional regulator n=1 Tax=Aliiroseovarius conchicola TaxID=3121637 RepID=UPI0035293FB3